MSKVRKKPQSRSIDPTGTTTLRRRFESDMRKRMRLLKSDIVREFSEGQGELVVVNARWTFPSASDGLSRFQEWLRARLDSLILGITGVEDEEGHWTDEHIETAYYKGATKAEKFVDNLEGRNKPTGIMRFLRGPVSLDKLKLIKARAFEQLRNVTSEMSTQLGNILADGVVQGKSPRTVGGLLNKAIDALTKKRALTIARTETIRAHNEGALEAMKKLGVAKVGVDVEWTATLHSNGVFEKRVCPQCRALQGLVIDIEKASGLIPRHPNCRCSWIPAIGETPDKQEIRQRIQASIKAGISKRKKKKQSFADTVKEEPWMGADLA